MPIDMNGPWHLLYPFCSSVLFVIGALFAKEAAVRGASPYTNTAACNFCLALLWVIAGLTQGIFLPPSAWGPAAGIACAFVLGQLCTYLAFQYGDVSLATPILGAKIIFVAIIGSLLAETPLPLHIWIAAVLASAAVGIVQLGGGEIAPERKSSSGQTILTITLALLAAFAFSCFDVGLQFYGRKYGAMGLLTTMFVFMGMISCVLLPWVDRPGYLIRIKAIGPLAVAAVFIAAQAISISYALGQHGDATRVNIIYSLRGLWSVIIAWLLSRLAISPEGRHSNRTMVFRFTGAILMLICVIMAMN